MRKVLDAPLVEVTWIDAAIDINEEILVGIEEEEEIIFGQIHERRDVGYFVDLDKEKLVLAVGIGKTDNSFNHSNAIPRDMIRKIEFLERSGKCMELKKRRHRTAPTGSSPT